jgi:hypothetical protein
MLRPDEKVQQRFHRAGGFTQIFTDVFKILFNRQTEGGLSAGLMRFISPAARRDTPGCEISFI